MTVPARRIAPIKAALAASAALLWLAATASADTETADVRLGSDIAPRSQAVKLKLDPDKRSYSGNVRVELDVTRATDTLRFHSEGQKLVRITIRQGTDTVAFQRVTGDQGLQTLVTARPLAKGPAVFEVEFTDPRMTAEVVGFLTDVTFPKAGEYRLQLYAWNECLVERKIQVSLTKK